MIHANRPGRRQRPLPLNPQGTLVDDGSKLARIRNPVYIEPRPRVNCFGQWDLIPGLYITTRRSVVREEAVPAGEANDAHCPQMHGILLFSLRGREVVHRLGGGQGGKLGRLLLVWFGICPAWSREENCNQ